MSDLQFYALRVTAQREERVKGILIRAGHKAFVKTERRLRRRTKKDKVRSERAYVAASSYVFLGTVGNPWRTVHDCHMIRSVVSLEGRPVVLNPTALAEFLGFDTFDDATPEYFRYFHTRGETFKVGEMVRIDTPSFDGMELRVKDIQRNECLFDLVMLGKSTEIRVDLANVYKAA